MKFSRSIQKLVDRAERALGMRRGKSTKTKSAKPKKRSRRPPVLTAAQSRSRVAELRAKGYRVTKRTLPDGTVVVLKSRRRSAKQKSTTPFGKWQRISGGRDVLYVSNKHGSTVGKAFVEPTAGGYNWDVETEEGDMFATGFEVKRPDAQAIALKKTLSRFRRYAK